MRALLQNWMMKMMNLMRSKNSWMALGGLAAILVATPASAFDHSHALFGKVLAAYVTDARVDYQGLASDQADLRRYLRVSGGVSQKEFEEWSVVRQITFLENLYNAATLGLIVDHYPVDSIKDIGGFFSGPWKQEVVTLWGGKVTLDYVEHGVLRKRYKEPRVHFALVCAAKGCPPLRAEPFVADRFDEQHDDQGRIFLRDGSKNRVDVAAKTLHLSPIFKWFADDFEEGGAASVQEFVLPYLPEKTPPGAIEFSIEYTHYDWTLNEVKR